MRASDLLAKFKAFDAKAHAALLARYPRLTRYSDTGLLEIVTLFSSPLFAVVAGLVGLVLAITTAHTLVVTAITLAWLISSFGILRSQVVRSFTIFTRAFVFVTVVSILALAGYKFGNWALEQYRKEHPENHSPVPTAAENAAAILEAEKAKASDDAKKEAERAKTEYPIFTQAIPFPFEYGGTVSSGINWKNGYSRTEVILTNPSEHDYSDLDIIIKLDYPLIKSAYVAELFDCKFSGRTAISPIIIGTDAGGKSHVTQGNYILLKPRRLDLLDVVFGDDKPILD